MPKKQKVEFTFDERSLVSIDKAVAQGHLPEEFRPKRDSICVRCGCTDSQACEGGCSWAVVDRNVHQGICSNCADPEDDE
jgi:hypothetical protein